MTATTTMTTTYSTLYNCIDKKNHRYKINQSNRKNFVLYHNRITSEKCRVCVELHRLNTTDKKVSWFKMHYHFFSLFPVFKAFPGKSCLVHLKGLKSFLWQTQYFHHHISHFLYTQSLGPIYRQFGKYHVFWVPMRCDAMWCDAMECNEPISC